VFCICKAAYLVVALDAVKGYAAPPQKKSMEKGRLASDFYNKRFQHFVIFYLFKQ